jgi:ribosome recycling factor
MADNVKQTLQDVEKAMQKSIDSMESDFQTIRTGRASPHLVDKVMVDYHGSPVSLLQLAAVSVPEPQLIVIRPYDPTTLKAIEKAILASDLKLTPNNDGKVVRLNIPPLTQERRKELAKVVGRRIEEAKVGLRNHRREGMEHLKKMEDASKISEDEHKRAKQDLEALVHRYTAKADELGSRKEAEILEM